MSVGTESGISYICWGSKAGKTGGGSLIDWFSLTLKLDDFTSGFRTKYADMAGGWEEAF
jgi:hypothetical protein